MVSTVDEKVYTVHGEGRDVESAVGDLERAVQSMQNVIGANLGNKVSTAYEVTLFAGGRSVAHGVGGAYKKALSVAKKDLPKGVEFTGQLVAVAQSYKVGSEKLRSIPDSSSKPASAPAPIRRAGGGAELYGVSVAETDLF